MKKKGYKGRCEKRSLSKCVGICRTYDHIQSAYADRLEADEQVKEFQCNVPLEGLDIGEYTTDFLCMMEDGSLRVRECVSRDHLMKPMNVKLLDASRGYWQKNGVADWKIVTDQWAGRDAAVRPVDGRGWGNRHHLQRPAACDGS